MAGISRGNLYKTYLNKGVVSISKDSSSKKYIETSELLRVFGSLKGDSSEQPEVSTGKQVKVSTSEQGMTGEQPEVSPKDIEIKLLREQLEQYQQREQFYQSQVLTLTSTLKLLEDKREQAQKKRWWQVLWR